MALNGRDLAIDGKTHDDPGPIAGGNSLRKTDTDLERVQFNQIEQGLPWRRDRAFIRPPRRDHTVEGRGDDGKIELDPQRIRSGGGRVLTRQGRPGRGSDLVEPLLRDVAALQQLCLAGLRIPRQGCLGGGLGGLGIRRGDLRLQSAHIKPGQNVTFDDTGTDIHKNRINATGPLKTERTLPPSGDQTGKELGNPGIRIIGRGDR